MNESRVEAGGDVLLTAKECAERMGLTVRGLRVYENRGLISPQRTAKNWRLYGAAEINRLHEILALKRIGLTLAQVANLLNGRAIDLDRTLAAQQSSIMHLRSRADKGLALVNAARSKLSAGEALSVADLIALAKETTTADGSFNTVARRRYEQARPRTAVRIDVSLLDRYVGHFQFENSWQVGTITRDGDRLFAKLIGQSAQEIFPESDHEFFLKMAAVQITFVIGPDGNASGLVLHHSGVEQEAFRIDDHKARAAAADLARKTESNQPFPGGEEAIRTLVIQYQQGLPEYSAMSSALETLLREQASAIAAELELAGVMRSLSFKGVGHDGWDVYDVNFANANMECRISLACDGRIDGLSFRRLP